MRQPVPFEVGVIDVVFAVFTHKSFFDTRMAEALQTWMTRVDRKQVGRRRCAPGFAARSASPVASCRIVSSATVAVCCSYVAGLQVMVFAQDSDEKGRFEVTLVPQSIANVQTGHCEKTMWSLRQD